MRLPWDKSSSQQLDLVERGDGTPLGAFPESKGEAVPGASTTLSPGGLSIEALASEGLPMQVSVDRLEEDPGNPRTEFPDAEIAELAQDIALRGILQPIVVLPLT